MSKRNRFHVVPKGDDWAVRREGASKPGKVFENKQDAVDHGRDAAKKQEPSQLIIHKKDGTIQTEYTYKKDPYPPKG
jgi:hypothetical protein